MGMVIGIATGYRDKRDNAKLLVIFRALLFACQTKKSARLKMPPSSFYGLVPEDVLARSGTV
jgi:hypothetical protein